MGGYVTEHEGATTCRNRAHRIAQPCTQFQPCEPADCAALCDMNEECAYFFVNAIKDCHLYDGCEQTRTAGHSGETCAKDTSEEPVGPCGRGYEVEHEGTTTCR